MGALEQPLHSSFFCFCSGSRATQTVQGHWGERQLHATLTPAHWGCCREPITAPLIFDQSRHENTLCSSSPISVLASLKCLCTSSPVDVCLWFPYLCFCICSWPTNRKLIGLDTLLFSFLHHPVPAVFLSLPLVPLCNGTKALLGMAWHHLAHFVSSSFYVESFEKKFWVRSFIYFFINFDYFLGCLKEYWFDITSDSSLLIFSSFCWVLSWTQAHHSHKQLQCSRQSDMRRQLWHTLACWTNMGKNKFDWWIFSCFYLRQGTLPLNWLIHTITVDRKDNCWLIMVSAHPPQKFDTIVLEWVSVYLQSCIKLCKDRVPLKCYFPWQDYQIFFGCQFKVNSHLYLFYPFYFYGFTLVPRCSWSFSASIFFLSFYQKSLFKQVWDISIGFLLLRSENSQTKSVKAKDFPQHNK